jgi:hypothetical protein
MTPTTTTESTATKSLHRRWRIRQIEERHLRIPRMLQSRFPTPVQTFRTAQKVPGASNDGRGEPGGHNPHIERANVQLRLSLAPQDGPRSESTAFFSTCHGSGATQHTMRAYGGDEAL